MARPNKKTFEEIALDFGLKQSTIELLKAEEVDSVNVVATLQEEDVAEFKLKLGQRRLLSAWIQKLSKPAKSCRSDSSKLSAKHQELPVKPVSTESLAQDTSLNQEIQDYMDNAGGLNGLFATDEHHPAGGADPNPGKNPCSSRILSSTPGAAVRTRRRSWPLMANMLSSTGLTKLRNPSPRR